MEYTLCKGNENRSETFITDVNNMLKEGWKLHGNLSVTSSFPSGGALLVQAMTRSPKAAKKATLPANWEAFYDQATENTWYRNNVTGEATYEFPTL